MNTYLDSEFLTKQNNLNNIELGGGLTLFNSPNLISKLITQTPNNSVKDGNNNIVYPLIILMSMIN